MPIGGGLGRVVAAAVAALVVAAAGGIVSPTRAAAQASPGADPSLPPPAPSHEPSLGFDTCDAPSVAEMWVWRLRSPYTTTAIYMGGEMRHCPNPVLDLGVWVPRIVEQGWRIIPIYVGPQAPCTDYRITISTVTPESHGAAIAADTIKQARRVGLTAGAPVYYDLEGYRTVNPACHDAVNRFLSAWTTALRDAGFVAGLYSSPDGGIHAQVRAAGDPALATVDAIWIARWNGRPNLFDYDPAVLPATMWPERGRIHQFRGDHDETWGGVTLNIDSNWVDGPVYPES